MMTARTLARFGNAAALALAVAVFCGAGSAEARPDPNDEYIIVSGGPSLIEWEQYRKEAHRHDILPEAKNDLKSFFHGCFYFFGQKDIILAKIGAPFGVP